MTKVTPADQSARPTIADGLFLLAFFLFLFGLAGAIRDTSDEISAVVATTDLEPFTLLTDDILQVESRPDDDGQATASALSDVVGRLILTPVDKAAIIDAANTVEPAMIAGRTLLTVGLTDSSFAPGVGERASLVMSPTIGGLDGLVVNEVIVVKVTGSGETAEHTLAVTREDLDAISPLLAVAELRLVHPITS